MKKIKKLSELFQLSKENDILNTYGIQKIGVLGSFAWGKSFSDIDLYIEEDIDFSKLFALKSKLESLVGIQVDIMTLKDAEPVIMYRAFKNMKYATAN